MVHHTIILGAGLAGLSAAAVLRRAGHDVLVVEKSRGLGGRAATRRWNDWPVDHGAQFFTARSEEFRGEVADWLARGVCYEWTRGFHQFRGGRLAGPDGDEHPRYACRVGMSSLGRDIAQRRGIRVDREAKIRAIRCADKVWCLSAEDGREYAARRLIVTCPPPQGADLLAECCGEAATLLRGIVMEPCLAVAACFPRRELPWRGIQTDDARVSWIANDSSKRSDLHAGRTVAVVHAAPGFSRAHFEASDRDVIAGMLRRASEISGVGLEHPEDVFLHRWRYAMPSAYPPTGPTAVFPLPAPLILAGESFAGGKIEGAWLSGQAAAETLRKL